jgi:hypothetical protein
MDILVSGTIVQALPVQQGVSQKTGNQWMTASYIIEHEHGQWPRRMVFDVKNQRVQELNLQVGETVTLHLNVDTREYPQGSGKFFNSIEAWKVERGQMQQVQQTQYAPQPQYQQMPPQQPVAQAPFPPQQAQAQQPQNGQLPFPPAQ